MVYHHAVTTWCVHSKFQYSSEPRVANTHPACAREKWFVAARRHHQPNADFMVHLFVFRFTRGGWLIFPLSLTMENALKLWWRFPTISTGFDCLLNEPCKNQFGRPVRVFSCLEFIVFTILSLFVGIQLFATICLRRILTGGCDISLAKILYSAVDVICCNFHVLLI